MARLNSEELLTHSPVLRRYAFALTRDASKAEDLVQQTFLRAVERFSTFKPDHLLRPWLVAIMRNEFLADERRQAIRSERDPEFASANLNPSEGLAQEEALYVQNLARSFATLPEQHRSVLHLVGVEGLTYREAADALGIPIGTIMSRLARARRALRQALETPAPAALRLIGGKDES
jgi:RNA polymerase sigma-70 factor (ECF subfamily)